jgi:hypothetical protein
MSGRLKAVLAIAVLAALGALVLCWWLGAFGRGGPWPRPEFEARVSARSSSELRGLLGNPDEVTGPGAAHPPGEEVPVGWKYRDVSVNPFSGKQDKAAWVWMRHDRVTHVTYDP